MAGLNRITAKPLTFAVILSIPLILSSLAPQRATQTRFARHQGTSRLSDSENADPRRSRRLRPGDVVPGEGLSGWDDGDARLRAFGPALGITRRSGAVPRRAGTGEWT